MVEIVKTFRESVPAMRFIWPLVGRMVFKWLV